MAQIIGGRVLENNNDDLVRSVQLLQENRKLNEVKRQNDLEATDKYLQSLASTNELGMYGVFKDNPDIAKRYLSLSGVDKKAIEPTYNQFLEQSLTTDLRRKEIALEQAGKGDSFRVAGEEVQTPSQSQPSQPSIPDPELTLAPSEGGMEGRKQNFPEYNMDQAVPVQKKGAEVGFTPQAGVAGFGTNIKQVEKGQGLQAVDKWKGEKFVSASFGEVKGGRFIPGKDVASASSDDIITNLLISSGYRAEAIEPSDVEDYKTFLLNGNKGSGAKTFEELLKKGFQIPARVLGKNEMGIIKKLTPELQAEYFKLMEQKEKADKAGNVGGSAKVQEKMNNITKGYTFTSPYVLSDKDYAEMGARLGTGSKQETVQAMMALAQLDSGQLDASLKQAQIGAYESQVIKDKVSVQRDLFEMDALKKQMDSGGVNPLDQLEYGIKVMTLKQKEREYSEAPAQNFAKAAEDWQSAYLKATDKKTGLTDKQKEIFIQNAISGNAGVTAQYKQAYLANAQMNNWGVLPMQGETEESFGRRVFEAEQVVRENINSLMYNEFKNMLGITSTKKGTPIQDWVGSKVEGVFSNDKMSKDENYRGNTKVTAPPVKSVTSEDATVDAIVGRNQRRNQ